MAEDLHYNHDGHDDDDDHDHDSHDDDDDHDHVVEQLIMQQRRWWWWARRAGGLLPPICVAVSTPPHTMHTMHNLAERRCTEWLKGPGVVLCCLDTLVHKGRNIMTAQQRANPSWKLLVNWELC